MSRKIPIWTELRDRYAGRHNPESVTPLAAAYWRALLVIAFAGIIGLTLFGLWEFYVVVDTLHGGSESAGTQGTVLNRAQLKTVLDAASAREASYQDVLTLMPAVPTDPARPR